MRENTTRKEKARYHEMMEIAMFNGIWHIQPIAKAFLVR
jgi:hypothetical protein